MDHLLTPDLLIGIGRQFDRTTMETTGNGKVSGNDYMAGSYTTAHIAPNFHFDARAAWGYASDEIKPFGTCSDSSDTERWLASADLTGEFDWEALKVRPEARLTWFREKSEAWTDSLNVSVPSVEIATGRFEFGPTFSMPKIMGDGSVFEPFATFTGIGTFLQENTATTTSSQPGLGETGVRGLIEMGFTAANDNGLRLSLSGHYNGIGDTNYEAWAARSSSVPSSSSNRARLFGTARQTTPSAIEKTKGNTRRLRK
jgi:outer membrane autotransporter protein